MASLLCLVLCTLLLTGCGQKGPLRRPEQVSVTSKDAAQVADYRLA